MNTFLSPRLTLDWWASQRPSAEMGDGRSELLPHRIALLKGVDSVLQQIPLNQRHLVSPQRRYPTENMQDIPNCWAERFIYGSVAVKNKLGLFFTVYVILTLLACNPPVEYLSEPLPESTIFVVEGINNAKIQFIWLELPFPIKPGSADVRLFLAKTAPPEPTIPNPNELRCSLSENETAILGPERIPFEFKDDGTFSGSYTYKACPECVECYMNWDYTLDITGTILEETVSLEIAIKHFGHNVEGNYVSAELALFSDPNKEPRITCNRGLECKEIRFVNR